MNIENIVVRTNPFKKSPARKKDGLHQVKIRVFVGKLEFGKFRIQKTLEIRVLDDGDNPLMMSASDFNNIDKNKSQQYHILKAELLIDKAVKQMVQDKVVLTSSTLFEYVYLKGKDNAKENTEAKENEVWNDEVKKWFRYPIAESIWEKFLLEVKTDKRDTITEDEVSDIADSILAGAAVKKELKRVQKMDYNSRYENGYYNKNNIFELFGFCWSINPKNGEPLIADCYKSVLFHLNDFRFNEKPSESVRDFNDSWIDAFLKFKVKRGYPRNVHIKGYDPFTISKYREKFITAKREIAREKTFQALVKRFKKYIDILQKHNLISYSKNTDLIEAADYLPRKTKTESFTRREHSLTVNEFDQLAETDFKNDKLNLARDMFIIAVLGGGFRPNELYDNDFYYEDNRLHVFRSKQDNNTVNPVFGQLKDVIERHNGIPDFMKIQDFRASLKQIADQLNFKRKIKSPDTKLDSQKRYVTNTVSELFNAYFARKTYVTILNSLDLSGEQIIEFTSHADQATLKYYKGRMTIEDKEKLMKKKLEAHSRQQL